MVTIGDNYKTLAFSPNLEYNDCMEKYEQLNRAIVLATKAHEGQVDRQGLPYILHPIQVMLRMDTETEMVTAVLHDVIEDTGYTISDIRSEGFSDEVIDALTLLSKESDDVPYMPFIEKIKTNALATKVKKSDIEENMRLDRSPLIKESDWIRQAKYRRALEYLNE